MGVDLTDYPSCYESEVTLRDGSKVTIRPIRPADAEGWMAFISRLGSHTKYLRFHYMPKEMGMEDALRFCTVDYKDTFALVAEIPRIQPTSIVAIGRYYRLSGKDMAEFALVVKDTYQGKGLGTLMMERLTTIARDNGITMFEGGILAENAEMIAVLRDYGFRISSKLEAGVYHVTFPVTREGS